MGDLLRGSRAAFLVAFAAFTGLVLSVEYYPTLANQLSPKEVFESYRKFKKGDEPLALLGVGGRTAAYYAGGQPTLLADPPTAYAWLMGAPQGQRRFVSVRADQLARLNQLYRAARRTNLPVLDGRSSQINLVASLLGLLFLKEPATASTFAGLALMVSAGGWMALEPPRSPG